MKFFKVLLILLFFALCHYGVFAQAGPADPGDPGCDPLDPFCPIDGGLSLLIAAGISLGAKKAYDLRKNKPDNSVSGL